MLKEFREFIAKGNVMDLAVGIIIGAAFTAIVQSFVKDILNPIIGLAGKSNFDNMFVVLKGGSGDYATPADAEKAGAVVLKYGAFLTNVINFLIIAFVVFVIVRYANKARKDSQAPVDSAPVDPTPAGPTPDQQLLTEIRDLLKNPKA